MAERVKSSAGFRHACRGLAAAAFSFLFVGAAYGQNAPVAAPDPNQSRAEYERISNEITLSTERRAKLAAEIATVRKDRTSITAALIQSAKTEQKLGQDIEDIGAKLEGFKGQELIIRKSLAARRDVLAEVLGALQRIGLNPPPALLVKPEDALSSVRSAILLGAVVPEMRHQTEVLAADLAELSRITASIESERGKLTAAIGEQAAEKQKLTLLLEAKRKAQAETEQALAQEQETAQQLAAKAASLKDLIGSLEAEADKTRKTAEAARREAEARANSEAELAALPVPEANQLAESMPFPALVGQVAFPATGMMKRRFGGSDGNGGVMQGDTLATQSNAIVTAPADGNVLYAGPFRSYGQLLILDAGGGYHVVLAGMNRLNVASGQSVLAGEPVGAMGEARVASTAASSNENVTPELYIEFRKDGKPVDPTPWWAGRFSGRT